MAMATIPNISFEIHGDIINLEQGFLEVERVTLHRMHIQHLAGLLGVPALDASAEVILRRFETVKDRLIHLADDKSYRTEIIERCGSGIGFISELDAVCDLAEEFLRDLVAPATEQADQPATNGSAVQHSLI